MAFEAKDLMIDVFPDRDEVWMHCGTNSPPEAPVPCQPPSCQKNSAKAEEDEDDRAELATLAVLRQELRQALHG
jgi:hypothetical protein